MNILVCVKQVLESLGVASVDRYEEWLRSAPSSLFRMNRFDEYAVEEALRMKDFLPQARVTAITVGPPRCESVVRRSMGMGAEGGIHVLTEDEPFPSPFATASSIAELAGGQGYDLLFAGVMSEDGMSAQVGPMVAELLGIPCTTSVVCVRMMDDRRAVYVEREVERGFRDMLEISLPAMITVQSGINQPRYPSLSHMLRAGKALIETVSASSLQPVTPREIVVGTAPPQPRRDGRVLLGAAADKARMLIDVLRERSLLR